MVLYYLNIFTDTVHIAIHRVTIVSFTVVGICSNLIGQWIAIAIPSHLTCSSLHLTNPFHSSPYVTEMLYWRRKVSIDQIKRAPSVRGRQAIGQCSLSSFSQCFLLINIKSALHNPV